MRKRIAAFIILIMCMSLCSCSGCDNRPKVKMEAVVDYIDWGYTGTGAVYRSDEFEVKHITEGELLRETYEESDEGMNLRLMPSEDQEGGYYFLKIRSIGEQSLTIEIYDGSAVSIPYGSPYTICTEIYEINLTFEAE